MPSILAGSLRKQIASGFKGRLLRGTIRRDTASGGLNSLGDPAAVTTQTFTFEGIREDFSAIYRERAGIPDEDVKILMIAGLIKPATDPRKDDYVNLPDPFNGNTARWHRVRKVLATDPATASHQLQCFPCGAPA
jgi:hypothetical protein